MYYYLEKGALENGSITVIFNTENKIPNYKEITNFGELIEYKGDNIPNDWVYDTENDVLFAESDRPSPYHIYTQGAWIIKDKEGYKKYCFEEIDNIKAKVLEYGFDYAVGEEHHRQKCRDKDIAYMVANIVALQVAQNLGINKQITWYFEDNHGMAAGIQELGKLMLYGSTFIQSVFNTESYFKSLEETRFITYVEFEQKRKEIHQALAGA